MSPPGERRRLHRHGDRPPLPDGRGGPRARSSRSTASASAAAGSPACCSTARSQAEKDRIAEQMAFFKAAGAPCIVYGETARSIQGDRSKPLATKPKLSEDEIAAYARKMTAFGEWCADAGDAARLPPPHGGGDRDRARARPLHEALGRGHPAALRRRPHGLRGRRRAARHRQAPRPHQPRPHQGRAEQCHRRARPQPRELPRRGGQGRLHRPRRRQPRLRGDRQAARRLRLRGLVRRRGRAGPQGLRRRSRWRRSDTRSCCASWTPPATA